MHFMDQFNRFASQRMPLLVLLGLMIGIMFAEPVGKLLFLVPYFFAFMTFSGTANANFRQLLNTAKKPFPLVFTLFIVHIGMPLLAFGVGRLFSPEAHILLQEWFWNFLCPVL